MSKERLPSHCFRNSTILFNEKNVPTSSGAADYRKGEVIGLALLLFLVYLFISVILSKDLGKVGKLVDSGNAGHLLLILMVLLILQHFARFEYLVVTHDFFTTTRKKFFDFILLRKTLVSFDSVEKVFKIIGFRGFCTLYEIKQKNSKKMLYILNPWSNVRDINGYRRNKALLEREREKFMRIFEEQCKKHGIEIVESKFINN